MKTKWTKVYGPPWDYAKKAQRELQAWADNLANKLKADPCCLCNVPFELTTALKDDDSPIKLAEEFSESAPWIIEDRWREIGFNQTGVLTSIGEMVRWNRAFFKQRLCLCVETVDTADGRMVLHWRFLRSKP